MAESDWEIIDPETMNSGGEKQEFSHEQLIMRSMIKCLDAGSKEMREGYYNEKSDKFGNIIKVYVEDTRKVFIQSVKILLKIMETDLDEKATKAVKEELENLGKKYEELCLIELKNMFYAPPIVKKERNSSGIVHRKNNLNKQLPFYQDYIYEEVDAYLKIFGILNVLGERINLGQEQYITN